MARHEFGILPKAPEPGMRFDSYEPEKYGCISVDDDYIAPLMWTFTMLSCYAHTIDIPCQGLVYTGITLIPPQTAREMLWMIKTCPALGPLCALLERAIDENKYMIHYGL